MGMKATHVGICQICGREQKLPGGRLSVHGYTVERGWFEGVCPGSGHLPFEQDRQRLGKVIEDVKGQIAQLEEQITAAYTPASEPVAPAPIREYGRGLQWISSQISIEDGKLYATPAGRARVNITNASRILRLPSDPLEAASKLRIRHAEEYLTARKRGAERFVADQSARYAAWKPAEVRPLPSK